MENPNINYRYVDGGMLIAIGSFFYFNIIFFLPFLWIAQSTLRKQNIREILFSVIGVIVPYIYLFTFAFLFDYDLNSLLNQIINAFNYPAHFTLSWLMIACISVYGIFFFIASFYAIMKFPSRKIRTRKLFQLLFYLFVVTLTIFFVVPSAGFEIFFVISIPLSVLFSIYFAECEAYFFNEILFDILVLSPIVFSYLGFIID